MAVVFDTNGDATKQSNVSNGDAGQGMESPSEQESKIWGIPVNTSQSKHPATPNHKSYKDILAYEDKWIGWDGPVWCSRYGRFENKEDASADDGYNIKGQPPHQDLGLERCAKHGCDCNVPFQHRSYVHDIQRRLEPMVASVVRLEHQVGTLVHHFKTNGDGAPAHAANGNGNQHAEGGFAERYDNTVKHVNHGHDSTLETWIDPAQRSSEPVETKFHKLEARVESLMHQLHQLMIHEGHHITEKEPDHSQGGR